MYPLGKCDTRLGVEYSFPIHVATVPGDLCTAHSIGMCKVTDYDMRPSAEASYFRWVVTLHVFKEHIDVPRFLQEADQTG